MKKHLLVICLCGWMLAPAGITDMGKNLRDDGKPVVTNEVFLGLANALLFEATIGSWIYTAFRPSLGAVVVSAGLTYASYRLIHKCL